MTERPVSSDNQWKHTRTAVALMLILAAVILVVGCVGEKGMDDNNNNFTRNPSTGFPSSAGMNTETTVGNIRDVLVFWNEQMHWNLSPSQIDEYSLSMENGVLKKYRTNPDYPHVLNIPDNHQFHREIGESLGFTKEESEDFVRAIDEYRQKEFGILDCPSWGNCSAQEPIFINFSVKPRPQNSMNAINPTTG